MALHQPLLLYVVGFGRCRWSSDFRDFTASLSSPHILCCPSCGHDGLPSVGSMAVRARQRASAAHCENSIAGRLPKYPRRPRLQKPLLILDLDETLLHASEKDLSSECDFTFDRFWVYRRPFLEEFLVEASLHYDLAVWSSASDDYVEELVNSVVRPLVPLNFSWGRSHGTYRRDFDTDEYFYAKDLYKVRRRGYQLSRVLIVDDAPRKVAKNYGNAIYVDEFEGDPGDTTLRDLAPYLTQLASEPEFRRIEKRWWRTGASLQTSGSRGWRSK